MMQSYRAELHVHTVLSPCAAVEMIPPLIVQSALENNIQIIAITDHNASANIRPVQQAAKSAQLIVLPGMEVQTQEEVHLLCLFDQMIQAAAWQAIVDRYLPPLENNIEYFGEQFIVDSTGDFLARENRLLLNSIDLSIETCVELVHSLGGLAIPAHVNRRAFGLFANLGMVPAALQVDALEISKHITPEQATKTYPQIKDYPVIQNGDVHLLDEFLGSTHFWIETPCIAELRLALKNEQGRGYKIILQN